MTYAYDRDETNQIHANDRDESRSARRFGTEGGGSKCYGPHRMVRSGSGGVCIECGLAVSGDAL